MSDFPYDLEGFLAALTGIMVSRGSAPEAALLAVGTLDTDYGNWDDDNRIRGWLLTVRIPAKVYGMMSIDGLKQIESNLTAAAKEILKGDRYNEIDVVNLSVTVDAPEGWREEALRLARGEGINNQGRVRSDNIATRAEDGLFFRSQPEIYLYRAFKQSGVAFAPLPVFLKGGESYRRVEPDFVVFKHGVCMVVEVDGPVHRERPVEADRRLSIFSDEKALVRRVDAAECDTEERARKCAARLLGILEKWRST